MFPEIDDDQRRTVARLAMMIGCGAIAVFPLTAQNSLVAGAASESIRIERSRISAPDRLSFPAFEIVRDPFVPAGRAFQRTAGSEPSIVLPPNAGAMGPVSAQGDVVVRAIVVGDPARALIESGGSIRVLGIGDRLGDLRVREITSAGVVMSDGSHLLFEGEQR
jgi:hypothetical protein